MTQHPTETVQLAELRPHPRNYQEHPEAQLAHLRQSLMEHGAYRNVVVAQDNVILAGHGVVQAALSLGWAELPAVRMPFGHDDPQALKLLAGDNELTRLAIRHDRALTEVLRDIASQDLSGLVGTGFDDQMLANLVMVTRPESEIAGKDEAAQWVGLPGFEGSEGIEPKLILSFDDEAAREALIEQLGIRLSGRNRNTWSAWYPPRGKADRESVVFADGDTA